MKKLHISLIVDVVLGSSLLVSMLTLLYISYAVFARETDLSAAKSLLLWQVGVLVYFFLRLFRYNSSYGVLFVKSRGRMTQLHGYDFLVFGNQILITLLALDF